MALRILSVAIYTELDVVACRQRAREIASLCGFGAQDQARIATAISELARNVFNYAGHGKVEFSIEGETAPQVLTMRVHDEGPGIAHLEEVLSGQYQSPTGMGVGLIGARRLMDRFDITSDERGTQITLQKLFPRAAPFVTPLLAGELAGKLTKLAPNIALSELQQQNTELVSALAELKLRQDELVQLTRELEDTNRGVVALYAELDEKADHLRRADELKSRFLSNMSHEFRTPLSSIRALSKLLLDRVDGELTFEQEKQVSFILQSAIELNELVNDLLDLAKIEAGKVDVKPIHFTISSMFSALRGMLKPLLVSERITLTFDVPPASLEIFSDEAKVSQILRNFISNALKFTEAGEIKVYVDYSPAEQTIALSVEDTGIGIAEADLQLVFEEFSQVDSHLQRGVKGTGLGLPLCRKLATLLNGRIEVESSRGKGSKFTLIIPLIYIPPQVEVAAENVVPQPTEDDNRIPLLVVEDNFYDRLIYEKMFADTPYRVVLAESLREASKLRDEIKPAAVILDIILSGEDSWRWLAEMKNDDQQTYPVIVVSQVEDKRKGIALGADAYYIKPVLKSDLLQKLNSILQMPSQEIKNTNCK